MEISNKSPKMKELSKTQITNWNKSSTNVDFNISRLFFPFSKKAILSPKKQTEKPKSEGKRKTSKLPFYFTKNRLKRKKKDLYKQTDTFKLKTVKLDIHQITK